MIDKHTSYTFMEVLKMPVMLKDLIYECILYDYGVDSKEKDEDFIDLDEDNLTVEEIQQRLAWAVNE